MDISGKRKSVDTKYLHPYSPPGGTPNGHRHDLIEGKSYFNLFPKCDHSVKQWQIGLYHPLDGVTNPNFKLCSLTTKILFAKRRRH
jgi:hypothetical protein